MTVSPLDMASTPSSVAAAIPERSAVFSVAPRNRQRRRLHPLAEGPANEAPLPGENMEGLPGKAALRDGQPAKVGSQLVAGFFGTITF